MNRHAYLHVGSDIPLHVRFQSGRSGPLWRRRRWFRQQASALLPEEVVTRHHLHSPLCSVSIQHGQEGQELAVTLTRNAQCHGQPPSLMVGLLFPEYITPVRLDAAGQMAIKILPLTEPLELEKTDGEIVLIFEEVKT